MANKEGYAVRIALDGFEPNGDRISSVIWDTFGYENIMANSFQIQNLEAMIEVVKKMSVQKHVINSPEPDEQAAAALHTLEERIAKAM